MKAGVVARISQFDGEIADWFERGYVLNVGKSECET